MSSRLHIGSLLATVAALTVGMSLLAVEAQASEEADGQASIQISLNLEIFEQKELDFGMIGRPSSGSNTVTLDWDSGDVTIGGDGDGFYVEGAESGRYRIEGPSGEDIEVTATIGDFGVDGIEVEETHVNGTSNQEIVQLNPSGMFFAEIGGVLLITSEAPAGLHTADFFITANYP